MIKGFRQIASLTALSRVFGLVRDVAFAHFFGAVGLMDAWVIAFQIPNLARRLFGEGAASASFIPVYRRQIEENPLSAVKLANTVTTVIFVLLAGLVMLGWTGILLYRSFFAPNPETMMMLSLISVMLPYMVMICTVAILAGILNVHGHFAAPAVAPVILNIFIIGAVLLTGWVFEIEPKQQVFAVAVAVLVAGLAQIAIQIPPLRASGVSIRPAWDIHSEAFRKIIILMGPMIIGLTVTQVNTLADNVIARFLSGSAEKGDFFTFFGAQIKYPLWRGSVSHLYFAQRLYQFPLGVLGIALATAIFPAMSADAARNDLDGLRKTISRGIGAAVFVAIPAAVGLILVARPLVSAVLEHGQFTGGATKMTAWTLSFYALGLCGFFAQQILTRAFYSIQDSKTPMRSAMIAVAANVCFNLTLVWFMGTAGLALSTAICSYLQLCILIVVLRKRFGGDILEGLVAILVKTLLATLVCWLIGALVLYLCRNLPTTAGFDILRLAAVVPSAATAYLLIARCLKMEQIRLFTGTKGRSNFTPSEKFPDNDS
ncbi:MAG: murein biosynthesis integral membrane protein MurJ [Sedimentisphaerales bacterium]|nr:murein biosynthesis integral membrane protein MurJ [Sedimentisphaerales bacterium]